MNMEALVREKPLWLRKTDASALLAVRLKLSRNLEKYPFPSQASLMEKSMVFQEVTTASQRLSPQYEVLNISSLHDVEKTLLFERDYISLAVTKEDGDRGVALHQSEPIMTVNGENHLALFADVSPACMAEGWKRVNDADTVLGEYLPYAYTDKNGFLLSRVKDCGTGLSVEGTMHLPALVLTDTITDVLSGISQLGCAAEGKFRAGSDAWGALFTVTAGAYAGDTEEEIMAQAEDVFASVAEKEKEARRILMEEAPLELEDKVFRSLGYLKYARLLSISQMLNLTSNIRLGIACGIVDFCSVDTINSITAELMQSSIALSSEIDSPTSDTLDRLRADRARRFLELEHGLS
ncbi:ATP--guanido phosphotransferase [Chitinivibrio alkaliphilus]|uniref:Putative ATP:guanido phosphotransferase n=1 Tax=Chitinivibrio alkaliphilus ACht1 TaxID=1313304 RepID=U7DCU5_9BACT|nr:ATP--guanido phosphotransferase [Chitinivibrio alkaliphilus]ERP38721.1 putative ATP:guanido phosphotransferase [Chitinivibrio alkaliphilus ACht1]